MNLIADLHIHSHYSLATSSKLTPPYLDYWAKVKGINIVGTGDFTHPSWLNELKEYLEPAESGLFKLKDNYSLVCPHQGIVRFVLSAEISNIYKKDGKIRKVHNVLLAPDFETVEKIQKKLQKLNFNITSDGRPIIGMSSEDLLSLVLEINEDVMFIPAHIWTPWFSALGSKSGFDSIEQCYGSLTKYIFAVETGLSSDQPLNWLCSFLDNFCLLSNSDAHSPDKLGRNANIFNVDLSYFSILQALKNQSAEMFIGTIDMYPQEGKYHYDGHRNCNIVLNPTQTMEYGGLCPKCGKPLTLGVAHRIAELSDRSNPILRPIQKKFFYAIPLKEILAEIYNSSADSAKIEKIYLDIIQKTVPELEFLLNYDIERIRTVAGDLLAEAIFRLRNNQVIIQEGYDGQYGTIRLFRADELKSFGVSSFTFTVSSKNIEKRQLLNFDVEKFLLLKKNFKNNITPIAINKNSSDGQKLAIEATDKYCLVLAGPGTGKTFVMSQKIKYLIENYNIEPSKILAITFSRNAANEIRQRLSNILEPKIAELVNVHTFHSLGFSILQQLLGNKLTIINDSEKKYILQDLLKFTDSNDLIEKISIYKNTLRCIEGNKEFLEIIDKYNSFIWGNNLVDYDDLIYRTLILSEKMPLPTYEYIMVDEFQDINNVQYQFLKKLAGKTASIFAIGDPNQSIYGFRGSSPVFVQKFIEEFSPLQIYLNQTYRCSKEILSFANNLVDFSTESKFKSQKVQLFSFPNALAEADFIARTINQMIGGTSFFTIDSGLSDGSTASNISSFNDFAILVRTKAIVEAISKSLDYYKIPYKFIDTVGTFAREPFNTMKSILKYFVIPNNKLFYDIYTSATNGNFIYDKDSTLSQNLQKLWNSLFAKEYTNLQSDFEFLLNMSKDKTLEDFLSILEQMTGIEEIAYNTETVKIMTMHAAKGLEFECVFIPAFEDGIIPYNLFDLKSDMDEEKRLLYVAATRAKRFLFITYSKTRKINNLTKNFVPSRFLSFFDKKNYVMFEMKSNSNIQDQKLF